MELPDHEARSRRHRPAGTGPQLRARPRRDRRRQGVHAPAHQRAAAARADSGRALRALARAGAGLAGAVGGLRAPALRRFHEPAAPRVRGRHAAAGVAG